MVYKVVALVACMLMVSCSDNTEPVQPSARSMTQPQGQGISFCPQVTVDLASCANHQGSQITLSGDVAWPGLGGRFILRNNAKGTHQREETVFNLVLVEAGTISFDKQPVLGGVGGNPHIWFQLLDGDGLPIGAETYLGRCVQQGK